MTLRQLGVLLRHAQGLSFESEMELREALDAAAAVLGHALPPSFAAQAVVCQARRQAARFEAKLQRAVEQRTA